MSSMALDDILQRIQELSPEDRLLLEEKLAQLADAAWRREAAQARQEARARGLDQAAIDKAIEKLRYSKP